MHKLPAGRKLIEFAKLCYHANLPFLLEGAHGLGKSELLRQAADELGIHFISRDLSTMEPPDLVGLPKMDGDLTVYMPPSFLPPGGQGLLVFEELNRCPQYMRAPCLQLLTARRLNEYVLPKGWLPVAAINPDDEGYEVQALDDALLSRFVRVRLIPNCKEWCVWAANNGIHPDVIRYVQSDTSVFDFPSSNPRAWKYVSDILWTAEQDRTPPNLVRTAVAGLVGNQRGAAFFSTLAGSNIQPLTADDILSSYGSQRRRLRGWIKAGRLDLVESTLRNVLIELQPDADFQAVKDHQESWRNLARFLHDLPGDLRSQAKQLFAEREHAFPRKPRS